MAETMTEALPLFDADGYSKVSLGPVFRAMDAAAKKRIGAPPGWQAFSWSVIDMKNVERSDVEVIGAVPVGVTKKGHAKYPKLADCDRVIIRESDVDAAKLEYERDTGKCSECVQGYASCGWSAERGVKYRPCERCNGTGSALSVRGTNDSQPTGEMTNG